MLHGIFLVSNMAGAFIVVDRGVFCKLICQLLIDVTNFINHLPHRCFYSSYKSLRHSIGSEKKWIPGIIIEKTGDQSHTK